MYVPGTARDRLQQALARFGQQSLPDEQAEAFDTYMELLLKWNLKMNLTAVRDADGIIRRHFLESIACARLLPAGITTLLDYGSGAGFPGVPCAICRPELRVTLAESQGKKAAFLREVVRSLGIRASVYNGRVDEMDRESSFDVVTLRAVDRMHEACLHALSRVRLGGWLAILATHGTLESFGTLEGVGWQSPQSLAGSEQAVLLLGCKVEHA